MVGNISLDHVQVDSNYNFKQKLLSGGNEDNQYNGIGCTCQYYEIDEFKNKFSNTNKQISLLSLNICSLLGKWDEFRSLLYSLNTEDHFKLTVIGVQEIWNVPHGTSYELPGYSPIEFRIRDPTRLNNNAGGGVAFWVDNRYEYEVIEDLSIFKPNVFESLFIKLKIKQKQIQDNW